MNKRTALIAVASVVILDLIATCLAVVNGKIIPHLFILHILMLRIEASPTVEFSMPLSSDLNPKKLRIESFVSSPGIDLCSIWLQSTGLVNYTRFNYELASIPSSKPILNVPPAKTYTDIDVVDGTTDCNVVAMDVSENYWDQFNWPLLVFGFWSLFRWSFIFISINGFGNRLRHGIYRDHLPKLMLQQTVLLTRSEYRILNPTTDTMSSFARAFKYRRLLLTSRTVLKRGGYQVFTLRTN